MPLSSGGRGRLHTPALPDSPVRRGMEGGREGERERATEQKYMYNVRTSKNQPTKKE